jgi:hypothetical protein
MSHPFVDIVGAIAVVIAVGAGTVLVLPRASPEPARQTIVFDIERPVAVRVEPQTVKSDVERVNDLQRRLSEISAEQKKLVSDLRAAVEARAARKDRGRKAR